METDVTYQDILTFWFEKTSEDMWFTKDNAFDETIHERFGAIHHKASIGELWHWRETIEGRLAEIIILDQFSRNLYRQHPYAFRQDEMALVLAQEAIHSDLVHKLNAAQQGFLFMPFMHSESSTIHDYSVNLFQKEGLETFLPYAKQHRDIIKRFGRYPHRNKVLGRKSTEEETAFLKNFDGF